MFNVCPLEARVSPLYKEEEVDPTLKLINLAMLGAQSMEHTINYNLHLHAPRCYVELHTYNGSVELIDGSSYFGQPLPFSITTLIWIEVLIGFIEFQRNAELEPEKRLYPGGPFDLLNLASDPEKKATLQLAEIKHARLAVVTFLGFAVQAAATGKGPVNKWVTHLSDALHTTILDTLQFESYR